MYQPVTARHFRPCDSSLRRYVALALFTLMLTACGNARYEFDPQYMFSSPSKEKNIGVVRFHFADGGESYEVRMRRVKGGYALQAPLTHEKDPITLGLTASRTRDLDYFIGLQSRYAF